MPSPSVDPQFAGLLTAWTAATAAGQATLAEAVAALESLADGHVVLGLPGPSGPASTDELPLAGALAELVDARPRCVRVAFPAPGDPLGLREAGGFTSSALLARSAAIVDAVGLVPEADLRGSSYRGVRWQAFELPATPSAVSEPTLAVEPSRIIEQTDRGLRRALRDATQALEDVDLARWRPEASSGGVAAAAALRTRLRALPPSWPVAAKALAERSIALWHALDVVSADDGAASVSASGMRLAAVRELSHAVREAAMVAFNVPASALLAGVA